VDWYSSLILTCKEPVSGIAIDALQIVYEELGMSQHVFRIGRYQNKL
jgi:hypothetical protein